MTWEKYYRVNTAEEVLKVLSEQSGEAQIIAGGTDLLVQMRNKERNCKILVDISNLNNLKSIEEQKEFIKIGSLVTHAKLANSSLIRSKARGIAEAAYAVGSPQIRNVGTIGGNVITAQPAADVSIALLSFDARVIIMNKEGLIDMPVEETFLSPGHSSINPRASLVTHFLIRPTDSLEESCFFRLSRRKTLCLPTLNLALWIKFEKDFETISDIRIAAGPVAKIPYRARKAESYIIGEKVKEDLLNKAAMIFSEEVNPRNSLRGSSSYKKAMAGVLLKKAIYSTIENIRGEQVG